MPKGIYLHKSPSEETKKKMRATHLRLNSGSRLPKAKKGQKPIITQEGREKLSLIKIKLFSDKTKHPKWKGGKSKCLTCNKNLWGYKTKYCMSHVPRGGENNPSWIDGRTPEVRKIRNSKKMLEWALKIKIRDNYTCQICGVRGGFLHSNHIKKFSDYPELRFELDNGITICRDCDNKWVKMYEPEWESYFNFNLETRGVTYAS